MRTITTTVYKFEELEEAAKQHAITKYREYGLDGQWWDYVYEDFTRVCECLGVTLDTKTVPLCSGKTRQDPAIYFTGFSSQGDGACFEGRYEFKKDWRKALKGYAPKDKELARIGAVLAEYKAAARTKHSGHYYHKYSMMVEVFDSEGNETTSDVDSAVTECMRDLADWLYRSLERSYEDQTSDEYISEILTINEYEFTKGGVMI